ncbi:MAG: hypothetical protein J6V42_05865 [Clostridia bacterium]|nr:hypothetical protein [Clostridia bacterium]
MGFRDKTTEKEIDAVMSRICIKDAFAEPTPALAPLTDPAQILIDEQKIRILSLILGSEVFKMSRYETFEAVVKSLPALSGSAAAEIFCAEISSLYGADYLEDIKSPRKLWEKLSEIMDFEHPEFREKLERAMSFERLDSVKLFSSKRRDGYRELISAEISRIDNGAEYVTLDISSLDFRKTDDFHASEDYKKYLLGDADALHGALSGALYPICAHLRTKEKTLLLSIDENYAAAERMIKYFLEREIMPNTVIFARGAAARASAERLSGIYKSSRGEIKIRSGILYYEGDTSRDIKNRLLDIAAVYPVSEAFVGGVMSEKTLISARHTLLKKGIAEALCELCKDENSRFDIAENI